MTNLPQGWEVKTLSEIGEIITGSTPSKSNVEFYRKDYPFFKPSDFEQGYFLENAGDNLSKLGFGKARQLPPKTILVVCIGSLGKVALTRVIGSCNQQINAIIPHKNIISEYIYYYCISSKFQSILFSKAPQTTLAIFNKTEFSKLEIIYPKDIKEQERIVGILDFAFSKIDENIKKAKENLANIDELMQSALQKAFNPLKDNAKENYKLPQSWEWKSLEEISENISAGGDKPKNCTESKTAKNQIPVYANGVNNNGLVGYTDKATIIKPSLTISARGTIGFVCIRKEPYFPIVRLISLIPCENILCLHYLYFCLNFFIAKGEGSSIPQLTIPKFKSLQIPLPPLKEQEQIAEHLDFVFEKAKALKELYTKELKDYEELKQSLLNKAFKGEL
ncbi:restriction endonuclease subunit S [Campylobacter jejuni]|nr:MULTISPECIES: restriction endonuclease subunit S [Campylobacter]APA80074.1 Type I restriction-modification system, specificity subunit S [Campylobacter jejuni subsp. jejuni M129]EAB5288444.1 restriction endonuclease subunit S [Campylobacter jejuni]EAB5294381.1 restriction endonuclease subunit S [Campylobacter jejuni]EAB5424353.1 restriction endonuclease subunit S [Campylobacter jejuni]EAC1439597.1 restriction endonuclease subunit S [Campylobacter jejuni]